jgi:hypothetical protein
VFFRSVLSRRRKQYRHALEIAAVAATHNGDTSILHNRCASQRCFRVAEINILQRRPGSWH